MKPTLSATCATSLSPRPERFTMTRPSGPSLGARSMHATMLHQLGLNHERLTYRNSGRDFRLTDVSGEVVRELLA
jgi:hypothetical protein